MTTRSSLAGALLAAVLLAGCSAGGHDMAPMPTPPSSVSAVGTPAAGEHDDADVTFAQEMVPHHRQAVEMVDMLLTKPGIDADVTALATTIKTAQAPEIDQMSGWLAGWGQTAMPSMDMGHDMPGGMSKDEMARLDEATGQEAAKLFLSGMIAHHQGAVTMAKAELADGQNPDAQQLAQTIEESQQDEIRTMTKMLARY